MPSNWCYNSSSLRTRTWKVNTRWKWRVSDFYYVEVDSGTGCKTKREACIAATVAKVRYLRANPKTRVKLNTPRSLVQIFPQNRNLALKRNR
jgi:hypothetical protein